MARQPDASYTAIIKEAREAEQDQDTDMAVKLYLRAMKKEPHLALPYERLMVIYRKQKNMMRSWPCSIVPSVLLKHFTSNAQRRSCKKHRAQEG